MGSQTAEAAGRCHRPGTVSTVAAGSGPFPGYDAVSPLLRNPQTPVGPTGHCGGYGSPHVNELDPHPMMHLCRTRGVHGLGKGGKLKPWGGLGHRETRKPSLTTTPRWSPPCTIVAPPRWPAGDGARDPATQPPRLDWAIPQIAC